MKSIVFRAFLTILLSWAAITNPTAQEISGMNASCLAAPAQPDTILYESFENGPVPNGWLEIDADADGALGEAHQALSLYLTDTMAFAPTPIYVPVSQQRATI